MRVPLEILACLEQLMCTFGTWAYKPTSLQKPSGSPSRHVLRLQNALTSSL